MTVYKHVINSAVDKQGEHRQLKCDLHRLHTAERSQQNLSHCKKQIGKSNDIEIPGALFDDSAVAREDSHDTVRNQAHDCQQNSRENQRETHGRRRELLHGLCLMLSPVLASHNHHTVSQCMQELLVHKLNLVDSGHPGQSRLAVCSQHHIVRQIYAQRHHILQHQNDRQRQKAAV